MAISRSDRGIHIASDYTVYGWSMTASYSMPETINHRWAALRTRVVMYQFSESTMLSIRAGTSVLQFIGILASLFRLWFRLHIRRLWWEDAWAFIACVCAVAVLVFEWMYLKGGWGVAVIGLWGYTASLICVIWAARMSILFSIARIVHPTERMRRIVTTLAVLFSLIPVTLLALKLWWLTRDLSWVKETGFYTKPARTLPKWMYVYQLCIDCISDLTLIFLAVRFLWSMNLPTKQRTMIIAIFCSNIIVTMLSVFRGVCQLTSLLSLVVVAVDLEVASSTISCNLLVIVTLVYRCSRSSRGSDVSDDDDYTTPYEARVTTPALTTVDFSGLIDWEDSSQRGSSVARLEC